MEIKAGMRKLTTTPPLRLAGGETDLDCPRLTGGVTRRDKPAIDFYDFSLVFLHFSTAGNKESGRRLVQTCLTLLEF